MSVEKFSISLPEELLVELDRIADAEGLTRSALIREAAASYVAGVDARRREDARRRAVTAAIEGFDQLADDWGADDAPGLDLLDAVRGESMGDAGRRGQRG
jgi:predicted transcriptional regulator